MNPSTDTALPTAPQLDYLKALAEQTGTSFAYPQTRRRASREIARLRHLRDNGQRPLPVGSEIDERARAYATAPIAEEIVGYGSSARWRSSPPDEPDAAAEQPPAVGERKELARYRVSSGERVLYAQRINGSVRITDRPAAQHGRSYLVERELERDGYAALKALVADYIEQAEQLDDVPMASSIVRRQLERLTTDA